MFSTRFLYCFSWDEYSEEVRKILEKIKIQTDENGSVEDIDLNSDGKELQEAINEAKSKVGTRTQLQMQTEAMRKVVEELSLNNLIKDQ